MTYKPKKSLGQNFMLSGEIANFMAYALDLDPQDIVVEIGAGLGAVTQKLSEALFEYGSKIYAVEIDSRFIPKLQEMFLESINVKVIKADILKWLPTQDFKRDFKVLGSLPFNITSPILHMLAKLEQRPIKSVLLIQKEVGEKISETAPNASYLSTFLQTFFTVEYLKDVPRNVFSPVPKVDGCVVSLERKKVKDYFLDPKIVGKYEGFLHKGFQTPRKMLNKPFSGEELTAVGVQGTKRPQELDVETWEKMFESLVLNN